MSQEMEIFLVKRCIAQERFAWEEFVDQYVGLVFLVIDRTLRGRQQSFSNEQRSDLCEAVFRSFRHNDFQLLREFEGNSSISAYLIILARRLVIAFLGCSDSQSTPKNQK